MRKHLTLLLLLFPLLAFAQKKGKTVTTDQAPTPTAYATRMKGYDVRKQLAESSLLNNIPFRSVGPTVMSGRVSDLDVCEDSSHVFYVAYASGGLWRTRNMGTSFEPMFEDQASMTIGDIAVDWKNGETIWLGSGESNSSRSSYAGTGIYKSSDKGKTWQHLGLEETHHIGRIILHPSEPNTLWVAALGHLYSPNPDRGVYKTTDGGKTWKKTLFVNENTGAIDLVRDPSNSNTLYAAMWERTRRAWNFEGNGSGSGIYKSTDGGETWAKLSGGESGFPATSGVGRIGLAVAPTNPQIVYAVLDNQDRREKKDGEEKEKWLTKEQLKTMSKEDFLKLDDAKISTFLSDNGFPSKYTAESIKKDVTSGKIQPNALALYLEDANAMLFDTPIKGAEMYRSNDGGKTWAKTHEGYIDDVFYTYGYYFGQVRVSPLNADHIYTYGVPIITSKDGGKTWESISKDNTHADHHSLWLSPKLPGHFILGNDGGVNITYDDGKAYIKANSLSVGQFYAVNVDMASPYNVYGGLQDNGVWVGPSTHSESPEWQQTGHYAYKELMGGDGMQVEIDYRDNNTVYTGYQFGNYYRINKATGDAQYITPAHELGETPYRWNWNTPIYLSRHNQDVLYMGSNKFHRSLDKGNTFKTLSGDLTRGAKTGNIPYGTLTTIHESPMKFGLLYTGSDDGLVHVSKDGGYTWENVSAGLPAQFWVSRVQASAFKESRVYVSLNGYRFDNFESWVFVSEDFGKTWIQLGKTLPAEPVNVVKEDPKNEEVLYVGTDHGVYVSLDRGKSFMAMQKGMPQVAVHDVVIHPTANELVVGTHGRSIYIADVSLIQQLTPELLGKPLHVFAIQEQTHSKRWGNASWSRWFGKYEPKVDIAVFSNESREVKVQVLSPTGRMINTFIAKLGKGVNYIPYDLTLMDSFATDYEKDLGEKGGPLKKSDNGKWYILPGEYTIKFIMGSEEFEQKLTVKEPKG